MVKRLVIDQSRLKALRLEARGAGIGIGMKALLRQCKSMEDVPADQAELVETAEYRGFTIQVHRRLDKAGPYRFQPTILKDGVEVRHIFVRSKSIYISREHYAKRAIDALLVRGEWPVKQGVTISR